LKSAISRFGYRLLNWKRLRAPAMPYFLRSLARASRVRSPSSFSRARLTVDPAAGDGRHDVELFNGLRQQQRLSDLGSECFGGEERVELSAIDGDRAFSRPQEDSS
jgi:hypothetical protein